MDRAPIPALTGQVDIHVLGPCRRASPRHCTPAGVVALASMGRQPSSRAACSVNKFARPSGLLAALPGRVRYPLRTVTIGGRKDLEGLRRAGRVAARCLARMGEAVRAGMTTAELDLVGRLCIEEQGARSAPELCYDFPAATCISVNEEVAHAIAGDRVIEPGDMVHIDVSVELDGYFSDTGAAYPVPPVREEQRRMISATRAALRTAIRHARNGRPVRHIGRSIERTASRAGFDVIRNLGSHGIGRSLHEEPKFVPGFDDPKERRTLENGLVLTIEPFLTNGDDTTTTAKDGWTLLNRPGSTTVQFEHTIVVTRANALVMTLP